MAKSGIVHVTPRWGKSKLEYKIRKLVNDKNNLREVHRIFKDMCTPYVPIDTGNLRQSATVSYKEVRWSAYGVNGGNYAHYMYEGIIYGPNIPITASGDPYTIVGWTSIPGRKKHPVPGYYGTGRLWYSNPKAASHWDKVMLAKDGDKFRKRVEKYLKQRAKEIK